MIDATWQVTAAASVTAATLGGMAVRRMLAQLEHNRRTRRQQRPTS